MSALVVRLRRRSVMSLNCCKYDNRQELSLKLCNWCLIDSLAWNEANPIIGINEGHNVIWIIFSSFYAPLLMNDFTEGRLREDCRQPKAMMTRKNACVWPGTSLMHLYVVRVCVFVWTTRFSCVCVAAKAWKLISVPFRSFRVSFWLLFVLSFHVRFHWTNSIEMFFICEKAKENSSTLR